MTGAFNLSFLILAFLCEVSIGQIKPPPTPHFQKFETGPGESYINSSLKKTPSDQYGGAVKYPMGANANDVIQQLNAAARRKMGYNPPVIPPSDPRLISQFMREQLWQYQNPQFQLAKEALDELNEARQADTSKPAGYFTTEAFKDETKEYWKAKGLLEDMLAGKIPLSLKDAFYILEKAYGDISLSYNEYKGILKKSAGFISQWLKENGHDISNNEALHFGIQKFMRDTLIIGKVIQESVESPQAMHIPFIYDYVDFRAEKDFRNYFITKTLATGTGQCNTLPGVYLLLAELLGAKTYLSYAPIHSFIKYPDNNGTIHNYETTTRWSISDQWYVDNFHITPAAKKSRIYLDTLNKRQVVAGVLMDLGYGYLRKFGAADGAFISRCVAQSIKYFPNQQSNVEGWLLRKTLIATRLHRMMQHRGIRDLECLDQHPEVQEVYHHLLAIEEELRSLGYEELPPDVYEALMDDDDRKGQLQPAAYDTKAKRDLFYTFNETDVKK